MLIEIFGAIRVVVMNFDKFAYKIVMMSLNILGVFENCEGVIIGFQAYFVKLQGSLTYNSFKEFKINCRYNFW